MTDPRILKVLKVFDKLNDDQRAAVIKRGCDVVVTAGAGSGKTYTLVARYATLLAEGIPPRRIAAITFTKKAALEMRSRVRETLTKMQVSAENEERQIWADLSAQMDTARIDTIHSLCKEILCAHPAEAGIDPRFEILDEGLGKAFESQAVDDTLKSLVTQEHFLPLLQNIKIFGLTDMLKTLLENRLESVEIFQVTVNNRDRIAQEIKQRMSHPDISDVIDGLRNMSFEEMVADTGDNLANNMSEILGLWTQAEDALTREDPVSCAAFLYNMRRNNLTKGGGKKESFVKESFDLLKKLFDHELNSLTGGKDAKDQSPLTEDEALFERLLPLLQEAFEAVHKAYENLVENEQALDFDDLEYKAQQLLKKPEIRDHWQRELDALLVDEFQDTNHRQREILRALTGAPGRLFIVGDPRQSIYRFRKADVTVFREEEERIKNDGGSVFKLNRTYRAHAPLLNTTGELLEGVINAPRESIPDYYVGYSPLEADRTIPDKGFKAPHVEFVFGTGEDAESARPLAARALATRLLQLKEEEKQIKRWDEVAVLFRASSGFPAYEEAFEDAGIPFVTVAGKGFYDRPEIRDLINILRAISDPMDDLAFVGLLRSPAFGLSDAALFLLRQEGQPYWTALQDDLKVLNDRDQIAAKRTRDIVSSLLPIVDRVPVSELLKQVVDMLDYRALLATVDTKNEDQDSSASGGRLWRNLDKLLEDAQASHQVSVRAFLDMLQTLNDAGAREGEAPAEADGSVMLMTIHKSKGLEFPVVVLGDASHSKRASTENAYLSANLGVTFKLERVPMLYKLAKALDKDQENCEELRLLYVALTRAKSKLLISAYAKPDKDGEIKSVCWAEDLIKVAGVQSSDLQQGEGKPFAFQTMEKNPLSVWCALPEVPIPVVEQQSSDKTKFPHSELSPLYFPLDGFGVEVGDEQDREAWQLTRQEESVPGSVLGSMVHKALQRWLFPGDPRLIRLMEAETFNTGFATEKQRKNAIHQTTELLERLHKHPIREEIETALERHHELPYSKMVDDKAETGILDLLYRTSAGWQIVDFKTDSIRTEKERTDLVDQYSRQLQKYACAVGTLIGQKVQIKICFLDDQGKMELVEISK